MTQPRTSCPVLLGAVEDRIRQPEPRMPVTDVGWLPAAETQLGGVPTLLCGIGFNWVSLLAKPVKEFVHNVASHRLWVRSLPTGTERDLLVG